MLQSGGILDPQHAALFPTPSSRGGCSTPRDICAEPVSIRVPDARARPAQSEFSTMSRASTPAASHTDPEGFPTTMSEREPRSEAHDPQCHGERARHPPTDRLGGGECSYCRGQEESPGRGRSGPMGCVGHQRHRVDDHPDRHRLRPDRRTDHPRPGERRPAGVDGRDRRVDAWRCADVPRGSGTVSSGTIPNIR